MERSLQSYSLRKIKFPRVQFTEKKLQLILNFQFYFKILVEILKILPTVETKKKKVEKEIL